MISIIASGEPMKSEGRMDASLKLDLFLPINIIYYLHFAALTVMQF